MWLTTPFNVLAVYWYTRSEVEANCVSMNKKATGGITTRYDNKLRIKMTSEKMHTILSQRTTTSTKVSSHRKST